MIHLGFRHFLTSFIVGLFVVLGVILPMYVHAAASSSDKYGVSDVATKAGLPNTTETLSSLVGKIVKAILGLVWLIFFVLMVYGGFLWMTARGETGQVDKAKGMITQAVIGSVIVALAWAITNFVISSLGSL